MKGPKKRWSVSVADDAPPPDAVSDDAVSDDTVSDDAVSDDAVSDDAVSDDAVSGQLASRRAVSIDAVPRRSATDEAVPDEPARGARETSVVSRKELARQFRRQAYQRAKQARATDPKHLAMKEAAKLRQRELYQQAKQRRKAREAELEAKQKVARANSRTEARQELTERVRGLIATATGRAATERLVADASAAASAGRNPVVIDPALIDRDAGINRNAGINGDVGINRELASSDRVLALQIERALRSGEVRELMERLARDSADLAARHREAAHDGDDEGVP